MVVVAKAIFSNFAIVRKAFKQKNSKPESERSRSRARKNQILLFENLAPAMAKLLKIALAATNIAQTSMLSFALLVLWSLGIDDLYKEWMNERKTARTNE